MALYLRIFSTGIDTKRDICYTVITYLGKFLTVRSLNPHMRKQKIWRRV